MFGTIRKKQSDEKKADQGREEVFSGGKSQGRANNLKVGFFKPVTNSRFERRYVLRGGFPESMPFPVRQTPLPALGAGRGVEIKSYFRRVF